MMSYHCSKCGELHEDLPMCFGAHAPALWFDIPEDERPERCQLSSDQCVIDEKYYFVLGRIEIPVHGSAVPFCWLAWVSLSEASFNRASELWEAAGRESELPCFGWLQSALPYQPGTLSLKTSVRTQPVGSRPLIEVEETDHPLSLEQQHGISMRRVQEIAEAMLHGG